MMDKKPVLEPGRYKAKQEGDIFHAYGYIMEVKETEKSYIFKLLEAQNRYADDQLETMFRGRDRSGELKMDRYSRGDVYHVEPGYFVGLEQRAGLSAVIVSNDRNNEYSATVEVVYFTTKDKGDLPTHVRIGATGALSTALCEQVHTVDKQRLCDFCGTCTKQELQNIDIALMISLGLNLLKSTMEMAAR